jgi:group I intron endonuclease
MDNELESDLLDQNSVIYLITNNVNGKKYVGQTVQTARKRFREHARNSCEEKYAISRAIRKYGMDFFSLRVLETVGSEALNEREVYWISSQNTMKPYGYNVREGGRNSPLAPESRIKIGIAHRGKEISVEHRLKVSESNKRRVVSEVTKEKMSAAHRGKVFSPEHCANLSISHRNRSPETRAKIGAIHKGKLVSAETRAKQSAAQRARFAKLKSESTDGLLAVPSPS